MPGGAATTAGMALMAGIAVMIIPSTMKSANVVASKSGGGRYSSFARTVGRPSTWMTWPSSMCQSGSRVWPFVHRHLVDPVADAGHGDADQLHETRADAGAEHGRAAARACIGDAIVVRGMAEPVDERRRAHDVDASLEDPDQLIGVGPHRVVD